MPLATSHERTADAPGIGVTIIPSSIALFMRTNPGSLIQGVHASETRAICFHSFRSSIIFSIFENPEWE
jgi:hypothetical protein